MGRTVLTWLRLRFRLRLCQYSRRSQPNKTRLSISWALRTGWLLTENKSPGSDIWDFWSLVGFVGSLYHCVQQLLNPQFFHPIMSWTKSSDAKPGWRIYFLVYDVSRFIAFATGVLSLFHNRIVAIQVPGSCICVTADNGVRSRSDHEISQPICMSKNDVSISWDTVFWCFFHLARSLQIAPAQRVSPF